MRWDNEPILREFAKTFSEYVDDVGCMDNPSGWIGSHKIVGDVRVYIVNDDIDTRLEIVGLHMDQLGGCGCPSGITIMVKAVKDE